MFAAVGVGRRLIAEDAETGPKGVRPARSSSRLPIALSGCFGARGLSFLGGSLGLVILLLFVANSTGQALSVALLPLARRLCPKRVTRVASIVSSPNWARPGMYELADPSRLNHQLAELNWSGTDDNFDDNRADMERYMAVFTHCLVQIRHLQTRHFTGCGDTRRKMPVTDF